MNLSRPDFGLSPFREDADAADFAVGSQCFTFKAQSKGSPYNNFLFQNVYDVLKYAVGKVNMGSKCFQEWNLVASFLSNDLVPALEGGSGDGDDGAAKSSTSSPTSGVQKKLLGIFERFLQSPPLTVKVFGSGHSELITDKPGVSILAGGDVRPRSKTDAASAAASAATASSAFVENAVSHSGAGDSTTAGVMECDEDRVCVLREVPDFAQRQKMLAGALYWERHTDCAPSTQMATTSSSDPGKDN